MFNGQALVNGTTFTGVMSNVLTVSNVAQANVGTYSVVVSNSLGTTTSIGAALSIIPITVPGLTMNLMATFNYTNGANPYSPIIQANDGNFYGAAYVGGTAGEGTIYQMTTNGSLTAKASFNDTDGGYPYGGLMQARDGNFYGSASSGGTYEDGVVYRATTGGSVIALASVDADNGEFPVVGMVQASDGNLYGTTLEGGDYGYGTIFRLTPAGALTTLVSLDYNDGYAPSPVLIQGTDGYLYGTCEGGGTYGLGTIFKMSLSGLITNLYSFTGGNDGASPIPGLVQAADGNFYGPTYEAGSNGFGTVFEITPSGQLTTRYTFTGGTDGGNPWGGLIQASDGNLYGTTTGAGTYDFGTIFQLAPTGGFATVGQFDGYIGGEPVAALTQGKDGKLYGTTVTGGFYEDGVVYQLAFNGALQITGQPADESVYNGGTAIFSVATFGGGPVSYQWQQNGINLTNGGNISGATSSTLVISNASLSDAAYYTVTVSNSFNSLTSDGAVLEVLYSPPHITQQPTSVTALSGTTATFNVVATGDQPLTYQWQWNGTNLSNSGNVSGATTSSLTISNLTLSSDGAYSVIVSNALFAVTSSNAQLTVLSASAPGTASSVLHQFADTTKDGGFPYASLVEGSDLNLYGTTASGGTNFSGTIFKSTLGGQFTLVYNFPNYPGAAYPQSSLMQYSNGVFYGAAESGGSDDDGEVFRLSGSVVANTYSFTGGTDGVEPVAGLVKGADGYLYGTALYGGSNEFGSVFKLTTAGKLTTIYEFTEGDDGGFPLAGVIQGSDGNLYGTTEEAGAYDFGTVYKVSTNGAFTVLYSFDYTNGANPEAALVQGTDGALYGTATSGGPTGYGTVFRLTTSGQLTTLATFNYTNGAYSTAALVQGTDGSFYGTTSQGGVGGYGTAFRVATNSGLTTLLWFDGFNGASPYSGLVQAGDGNFYGTTAQGGAGFNPSAGGGGGTIFKITVPIFTTNLIVRPSPIACLPYPISSIANAVVAPPGDTLTYDKVSGPAWLIVGTNGTISGTPTNSDIGTEVFVVSLTDTNGLTATTKLQLTIVADPPPSFVGLPISVPWASLDQPYSASVATNATDQEINAGDVLTFGKVGGPAWLNVGADGTLSGTPQDVNAGLNTFLIGVTNLGGAYAVTFLSIYVDSPPTFSPVSFSEPSAIVGIPYSGSIATNATDPDLSAGDHLSFYLVTGPSWLSMTTNGVLSGTPSSTNLGANSFLALVTDSQELSAVGTMNITVVAGSSPAWMANPFAGSTIAAGTAYSGSVATNAIDPNRGGIPTFVKMSGPAWLNVGANGSLSGTPLSANAGTNVFVIKVADGTGLWSNASFMVNVTAAPTIVLNIAPRGSNVMLNWSGGVAPYQVLTSSGLEPSAWQSVGSPTMTNNVTIVPSHAAAFYKIQGQ